jgi:hypothetical protein
VRQLTLSLASPERHISAGSTMPVHAMSESRYLVIAPRD